MKELIIKAKNGDKAAITKIIEENTGLIYSAMINAFGTCFDDDYKSIGYGAMLDALNKYNIDSGAKFSTFAYSYIYNEFRHEIQSWGYDKRKANYVADYFSTPIAGDSNGRTVGDTVAEVRNGLSDFDYIFEKDKSIWGAIETLNDEERKIFELKYILKYPRQEIANMMGWKNKTSLQSREASIKRKIASFMGFEYDTKKMFKRGGNKYE